MSKIMTRPLLLAAALALAPPFAHAEEPLCGPRSMIVGWLVSEFGESMVGAGINGAGIITEMWASPSGSWTIVNSNAEGVACIASSGQGWETAKPAGQPA